jgi:hypothetical protein
MVPFQGLVFEDQPSIARRSYGQLECFILYRFNGSSAGGGLTDQACCEPAGMPVSEYRKEIPR